jgi:hypothetical protein
MSSDSEEFKVGDSVLLVGTDYEGELGTIIRIAAGPDGPRYIVVLETGKQHVFKPEALSHRH